MCKWNPNPLTCFHQMMTHMYVSKMSLKQRATFTATTELFKTSACYSSTMPNEFSVEIVT